MANKTILFTVRRQHLHSKQVMVYFPSNIVNYIAAEFDMDEEWNECDVIKAVWYTERAQIATVLESGSCIVPREVLVEKAKVYVNLVGSVVENGEIIERITSYPYLAIIVDKNAKIDGSETVPVTPSQFEQFVDAVKSETSKVTGMTATAETLPSGSEATASYSDGVLSLGIPMGAQGEKGDTGERGLQGIQGERGERGEQGLQGAQGERGERGETGATGAKGDTGNGISSITKTGSSGLVDTYTITFTDGTSTTFNVTNGKDGSGADIDVDSELSTASTNPVQNKVITNALNAKANTSSLASVATTGNYNDLSNKPTIPTVPTKVSAFTNDAGYITSVPSEYVTESELSTAIAGKANTADLATVATSGSYADLTNKPTIPTVPTNVSAFTNDAHYITASGAPVQSVNGQTGAVTVPDTDTTYTLSMSGNVITLTPSSGTASSITLPVSETAWGDITGTLSNQTDLQTALNAKQNTLTAGDNITIENNVISASGGGSEWRMIADITTTEAVQQVSLTTDMDGNPFNVTEAIIYCEMFYDESISYNYWGLEVNGVDPLRGNINLNKSDGMKWGNFHLWNVSDAVQVDASAPNWQSFPNASKTCLRLDNAYVGGMTSFRFKHAGGGGLLGTGCVIKVWGK